ncbi:MAG: nucleotidyltransferase family protein [Bryobacteraceae bacterium]
MNALAGIVLAAGASRRMGSPKALLEFQGETFLDRLIGSLNEVCAETIVVLGYHADLIRGRLARSARFVVNPDPDRGQLTSLQCGLAAISGGAAGVLFTPLDFPAVRPETIARLAGAFVHRDAVAELVIPSFHGRRGHPVLAASALIPEFLALPETAAARDVVRRHDAGIRYVEVDDAGVVTDIDTQEDYRRLLDSQGVVHP